MHDRDTLTVCFRTATAFASASQVINSSKRLCINISCEAGALPSAGGPLAAGLNSAFCDNPTEQSVALLVR